MRNKKIKSAVFLPSIIAVFFLGYFFCGAQSQQSEKLALRVSPLYYDLEIQPGEENSGVIILENVSDKEISVQKSFSDFSLDAKGGYFFYADLEKEESQKRSNFSLKDWFLPDELSFVLKAREKKAVRYKITAPKNAVLGGHYGVIFFSSQCEAENGGEVVYSDKSNVCVSARVGVLFLVNAGGDKKRSGEIKKVEAPKITFSDKANVQVGIANTGNTHFKPTGEITARTVFGTEIGKKEIKDMTILPDSSRYFSGLFERGGLPGIIKIQGKIKDGEGKILEFEKTSFLVPWKEAGVIIVLIFGMLWANRKYLIVKKKKIVIK